MTRTTLRSAALCAGFALIGAACTSSAAQTTTARAKPGVVRNYFVAADQVDWDYAPSGRDGITGEPFDDTANVFMQQGPDRIGHVYRKSLYREYTDATFSALKVRSAKWQHLGDLGPVLHAEVGDTIRVTFRNNLPYPASMHPHGVFYEKASEGAPYHDGIPASQKGGDSVAPGATFVYTWRVPERSGPGPMDGSSVMWMYHSHVDEIADVYAGLMGAIIVTRKGMARADGSPKDVDREFVVNFEVANENASQWLDHNVQQFAGDPGSVDPDDEEFNESNLMHSINGYSFGNLTGLTMRRGEHVRWYVMGMGTEVDLHTPHWHGNTLIAAGMRTDVVSLLPATMVVADMWPDNAGTWLFHCHVADHIAAGMMATYQVS